MKGRYRLLKRRATGSGKRAERTLATLYSAWVCLNEDHCGHGGKSSALHQELV